MLELLLSTKEEKIVITTVEHPYSVLLVNFLSKSSITALRNLRKIYILSVNVTLGLSDQPQI